MALYRLAVLLLALTLTGCAELRAQQRAMSRVQAEAVRVMAQQGDAKAQFTLGEMYEHGNGVTQNVSEALKWYQASAEQGFVAAQSTLGYLYQYGEGVEKDPQAAFMWNLKAAEQGDASAQHNLAVMYDEGLDVPENNSEAVKWYRRAADQGYERAALNLGVSYWRGEGVSQNYVEAYRLLNHLRVTSHNQTIRWKARSVLDELKKVMTDEQIRAASGTPDSRFY